MACKEDNLGSSRRRTAEAQGAQRVAPTRPLVHQVQSAQNQRTSAPRWTCWDLHFRASGHRCRDPRQYDQHSEISEHAHAESQHTRRPHHHPKGTSSRNHATRAALASVHPNDCLALPSVPCPGPARGQWAFSCVEHARHRTVVVVPYSMLYTPQ